MNRNLALIAFPTAKLAIHLASYRGYGMFRDELYYLACADHLAWGYVDHPPLSIFLLWLVKHTLGDSLFAVRLLPGLIGAATVLLSGLIARRMGGGVAAEALAMLAVVVAPLYLAASHVYSMNSLDVLIWALSAYLILSAVEHDHQGRWIRLGVVLGLGLLNKISVLWLGLGLLVGLLATEHRRRLLTRGPWVAGAIAAVVFLPHVLWQVAHDWPTVEFVRNATQHKMAAVAPLSFLKGQILAMNVATLPLWLAGLAWLLLAREGRRYRVLGVVYLTVFVLLVLNGTSRTGYLAPAYTWLFPAGAVALDRFLKRRRGVPGWGYAAVVLIAGLLFAPFGLPVLPVERYVAYAAAVGIGPSTAERKELAELPQWYADMHGWSEIVETVAEVYRSLPPHERREAAIFTFNYGNAGAVDYYGRQYGLPGALGGHNNYWLWGPGDRSGAVVIVMGDQREDLEQTFEQVELGAMIDCGRCMPYENDRPIWIARGMRRPLSDVWPELKHFD